MPYDATHYYAGRRVEKRFTLEGEVFEGDWVKLEEVLHGIGERYKGWKVPQVRRGLLVDEDGNVPLPEKSRR